MEKLELRAENEHLKQTLAKVTTSEQSVIEQNKKLLVENQTHSKALADANLKFLLHEEAIAKFRAEKNKLNNRIRELTLKVPVIPLVKPIASIAPKIDNDLLSQMIQIGKDNKLDMEMAKIESVIDTLREKHGISVRDHLGFGSVANAQLKVTTD